MGSSRLRPGRNWWRVKRQVALLGIVVAEWLREGVSEMTAGGLGGEGHKRLFVLAAELGIGFLLREADGAQTVAAVPDGSRHEGAPAPASGLKSARPMEWA